MAEEINERGSFKRWNIPYEVNQWVVWKFYHWRKVMQVTHVGINSITLREHNNPNFFVIEYEDGIDKYVSPVK